MKRIYFLLLIVLTSMSAISQKNDTIYKVDSSKIIEDITYYSTSGSDFKYSKKRYQKKTKIPVSEISKVVLVKKGGKKSKQTFTEVYKPLNKDKKKKNYKLVKIRVEGYCELFEDYSTNAVDKPIVLFYLIRPNEFAATEIKRSLLLQKSRSSVLLDYFSDCPSVVTYINSLGKINRNDLIKITKKYNTECTK